MQIFIITAQTTRRDIDGNVLNGDLANIEYAYLDGEKAGKMLKKLNKSKGAEHYDTSYDIHCVEIEDCKDSFNFAVAAGMTK